MKKRKIVERDTESDALAIPISDLYFDKRIPWGRDKITEHADAGILPAFSVGRRRFVAVNDLETYIENLKSQ